MFAASKTATSGPYDPNFANVVLLLNDTGTNGQQNNTFLDSSSNNFTVTRNSAPTQGSFTPYIPDGDWGVHFDGTGDYITTPSNTAFAFGTGDFTLELWVFAPSNAGSQRLLYGGGDRNNIDLSSNIIYYWNGSTTFTVGTININQWNHVAVSRVSGTVHCYLNGTRTATGSDTSTGTTARTYTIGAIAGGASGLLTGSLSNVRILKGTGLYSGATINVPTAPLTAIANTSLLTCQSNRFIDNSSNNFALTVSGDPRIRTFSALSGGEPYSTALFGGSAFMNGTSDYLTLPSNTAFTFGTGDFTIEAWVYHRASGVLEVYLDQTTNGFGFSRSAANKVQFAQANVAALLTSTTNLVINQWNHVAVTRSGTTGRLFLNGVLEASATMTTNFSPTTSTTVGRLFGAAQNYFNGFMSNLRIIKGAAIYTAAFTPPIAPVTSTAQTSALLNFANAGVFDSTTINDLSTLADAQVSTTQAKFGGSSVYLDGTGDYLTCIDTFATRFATADFTVELWVYLSRVGLTQGLVAKGTASTGWATAVDASNKLIFVHTSTTAATGATSLTTGQWYHVAFVRSGTATGNVKIYLNGTLDATSGTAITNDFNQTNDLNIGAGRTGTSPLQGYIDQLRLTNGVARYTATFTPPTQPFPTR